MNKGLLASIGFVALVIVIGAADYLMKEAPDMRIAVASQNPDGTSDPGTGESSSATSGVKKGVSRRTGPNVKELLVAQGFTWTEPGATENIVLKTGSLADVQAVTILQNNDRLALFAWIESPDAKIIYQAIKRFLQGSFSGEVRDLIDTTEYPAEGAPYDILSFVDPALYPDRIAFVRVRERLYEFHITDGKEDVVQALINELTQ